MKKKFILLFLSLILIVCGKKQVLSQLEPEDEFERAMSFYEKKDYNKAVSAFERILFYHPSSEYVDDAQYWLGNTYFEKGDYDQAIIEFDYLIKNFPTSSYLEKAYVFRIKAYFEKAPGIEKDPTEIENAIDQCNRFLTRFPNSEFTDQIKEVILVARNQLARKELENGKLYLKLGVPESALLYFEYVSDTYPETESSAEAKFRSAGIYEKQNNKEQALELYRELLEDGNWQDKAAKKIAELEKADI
jgi:outer membrane protein assembly factor BamD